MQEFKSFIKYIRISPKKLVDISKVVKGKNAQDSIELLKFIPKKSARFLSQSIKSALFNAKCKLNDISNLKIDRILIGNGPKFKRFRPVSRGTAHPFCKKTSHIKIFLK